MRSTEEVLDLKERINAVRKQLPRRYKRHFFTEYPEYDTSEGSTKLDNVMYMRSTDPEMTEKLERFVEKNYTTN